ncbi:MAG: Re/Si-specific NAD(P)(+) transhydrogenase subunit alpha [Spirochaetia bacterium]|nr:Re/Si-specific NAD(P)(+) transhydrogenase subunit alpha [Spirochaetia bacterium]
MKIAVPKEFRNEETRVALIPEVVAKLIKLGYTVDVERGAGVAASFLDEDYVKAGATIVDSAASLYAGADILVKVQKPDTHPSGKHELEMMKKGGLYVGFFYPLSAPDMAKKAAALGVGVFAMDAIPRITKAQRMDALSSQTNLAGYRAVLYAASSMGKIFPLMMTAAGTISPAKVVIIGAGVAGLQAIATARRLGAIVEVSDVRPAVKEQVESLGGKYIEVPGSESLEGEGGYAKQASAEFLQKQQDLLRKHILQADAVITTALVPGAKAPVLVKADVVEAMKPGAVIVDMAAEQGGNCELTEPGKTVVKHGVTIVGDTNIPARVAVHASQVYARNILSLIEYLTSDGKLNLDPADDIVKGALIVNNGEVVHEGTRKLIGG